LADQNVHSTDPTQSAATAVSTHPHGLRAASTAGAAAGVFYWWALLTMLDVAAALYAIGMEGEDLRLIPYAIAYRFFFITMIDVAKLFATAEEVARVRMTWGKLERVGRL